MKGDERRGKEGYVYFRKEQRGGWGWGSSMLSNSITSRKCDKMRENGWEGNEGEGYVYISKGVQMLAGVCKW